MVSWGYIYSVCVVSSVARFSISTHRLLLLLHLQLSVCAERLQPQEPGSSSDNSPVAPRLIFNSHQSTMANVDSAVKKSVKGADWIDDDEYNKQK